MKIEKQILSLPELALQHGTITKEQYRQAHHIYALQQQQENTVDWGELLLHQRFATNYQVGLLKLIQEYLILKKKGEEFGKIAIEKGFASQEDVDRALELQKKEFKRAKIKKLIGDILVESRVITVKQKNSILKEQTFLDRQAEKFFDAGEKENIVPEKPLSKNIAPLSNYDEQFLKIKVLDKEFAAAVIEKGLASKQDVAVAQEFQDQEFEKKNKIRILGDIMVELSHITQEQKEQILIEHQRLNENDKQAIESGITVSISPDQMEAVVQIDLKSRKKSPYPFKLEDIKQALESQGISHGIYPDPVLQCHIEKENTAFIAARQDYSVELIKDRKARYHFTTEKIDPEIKEKGTTLAEQELGRKTRIKKDIFGNNLEQACGLDFTFRCSIGTRLSKDRAKAFAGKSGFPSLSIERKLYIHPSINVLEDADLKYGPLEKYANLKILGILTGAYPVTAGNIAAREIRGADITAIGNVAAKVGINKSTINTQGDVRARYIHSSTIYAFGDVYVENEIIDSKIYCSGKIKSPGCRTITSDLFGKKGVELAGVGNERTRPCTIAAGTEHHILEMAEMIDRKIQQTRSLLDDLTAKKEEQAGFAGKTFQKMVELKIFHDRAKKKKEMLSNEFRKKRDRYKKEKLKNIATLVNTFQNRMDSSVTSLKELNFLKKKYEKEKLSFEKKIKAVEPKIQKEILDLKADLLSFLEWARKNENVVQIKINQKIFSGTIFKGIFSFLEIEEDLSAISISEKQFSKNNFELVVQKK